MPFDGGDIVVYALTGAAAGFFAGLLGIGGGVIISPLLIFFLPSKMAAEVSTHAAIATALAITTVTTAASFATHAKGGAVHWRSGILLAVGAASAAVVVGAFAWRIPAAALQGLLAAFLLFVGITMLRAKKRGHHQQPPQEPPALPPPLLVATGGIIGALSAVLGIAGGIMTVPFLARRRFVMHRAIGTSAFVGFPLTAAACVGYIGGGWHHPALPPGSWGFVYPPAFFGIVIFSVIFAAAGARTTAKLPESLLRKIFGALLVVAAARLLGLFV